MTQTPPNGMPTIYPALAYRDAPAAIDWLQRAFGFEPLLVVPGEDGSIVHAEMAFGTSVIMLGTLRDETGSPVASGTAVPQIHAPYVYVHDLDAHYARAQAAGAEITRDLEAKDYGGSGYSARDCEGNEWSFGTYVPGQVAALP